MIIDIINSTSCAMCYDQKSAFQGLSLKEAKRSVSEAFVAENGAATTKAGLRRAGLRVTARTAGAAKNIEVEVDKPLGLTLGQKSGGGVVITVCHQH